MSTLPALQWRYSLKQFSSDKVPLARVHDLIEAARLAASSYGLQPYQIWVIDDSQVLAQLSEHAYGQSQITQCSHLLVLVNDTQIGDHTVDRYFQRYYQQTGTEVGSADGYAEHIKSALAAQNSPQRQAWAQQQAYLALGALLSEAAMQRIDACPMTGFDQEAFNHVLGLTEKQLNACVICAVGYRDNSIAVPEKVRTPTTEFAHFFA
ncbi:Putative NAD(P)H nitroreductase [Marinomonas aquimarina]|uniref:Putative NAD(P)H nitroreductase n=1 Tax=Marinomonas aquimarina TaxID=295068 RepID=A0A1A8TM72_9GAMM|nr:nitroreductase family protein [Marinomonas aquimarina]SBS34179.1 Putative NAD(P)H nitroreductase [Marinomonas aquimarina]